MKLLAPGDASLHYGLVKRIEDHTVQWIKRDFEDNDLTSLGRDDVDHIVDMVFVTLGARNLLSMFLSFNQWTSLRS